MPGAEVHLPVSRDDGGASRCYHAFLSCKAATPGRTRPSRNSSDAPPPVETCVICSAAPAASTAAAESPPPIMVNTPACLHSIISDDFVLRIGGEPIGHHYINGQEKGHASSRSTDQVAGKVYLAYFK